MSMSAGDRLYRHALYTNDLYEGRECVGIFKVVRMKEALEACEAHAAAAVAEVTAQKDGAYDERNRIVAALAAVFPSALSRHPEDDTTWDDDWRWIVFVDLPTGQASWHIHDSHLPLFAHVRREPRTWDGHTTPEKYERVARFCNADAVAHRKAALAAVAEVTRERDLARELQASLEGDAERLRSRCQTYKARVAELEAEVERLREAIRQTAREMNADECIAGKCFPDDPEEPPCPWLPIAAALAPQALLARKEGG